MEYMNVVRMRLQPGKLDEWRALAEKNLELVGALDGAISVHYLKTGDDSICVVGRWTSEAALAAARPRLIESLNQVRHLLVGDTDPVSGPVVLSRTR